MILPLHLIVLANLLPLQAVFAVHHQARSVDDMLSGLDSIDNQLGTLSNSLQGFEGGLDGTLAALQIQGQTMDLVHVIDDATAATNQTSNLNKNDSITLTNRVAKLQDVIFSTLDLLEAKKPAFDTAVLGVASASILVKADLDALRSSTAILGRAIVQRLDRSLQNLGPLLTGNIDFHFVHAIQLYS
ncbi:cell wall mannoprotein 1 family protein [Aspergillus lucknowensis]|uniref:Hydrophobic surface binding protein A-domain-containing protein n=1 Tax=Aspergillus lucknowensis TaxID=176173 RepID=A0ABR4LND7_9EURO